MLAMQDPEAAVDLVEQLEDDDARRSLIPMVVSIWSQNDARAALDWASDRPRGQTRDSAISQVAGVLVRIDPDLALFDARNGSEPRNQLPGTADESRVSDFSTPKVITSRITQTGNAAAIDAACSACSPSTRSNSAATTPIDAPQTTRKRRGG